MNIAVVGTGYVGLANAILLAQNNDVVALDLSSEKIAMISRRQSPIADKEIQEYLAEESLSITGTTNPEIAYKDADFVIIATPTDYDPSTNHFDTSSVDSVIQHVISTNPKAVIIIKSTVPVGFTAKARKRYKTKNINFFSRIFTRRKSALRQSLPEQNYHWRTLTACEKICKPPSRRRA